MNAAASEEDLIDALRRRDQRAWRDAIRDNQGPMLALARSIGGNKIADEIVQEAWISAMRAIDGFEGRSSLKTWLMRIVANEAKTRLRKERRQVSLEDLGPADETISDRFDRLHQWRRGTEPGDWADDSPDELISSQELEACMDHTIERLPELQQATLRLREHEGYSMKEICNILDVSESNVRVLLHRARSKVFKTVEHFQQTGECLADLQTSL